MNKECPCYIAGWEDCEKAHQEKLDKDISRLREIIKESDEHLRKLYEGDRDVGKPDKKV